MGATNIHIAFDPFDEESQQLLKIQTGHIMSRDIQGMIILTTGALHLCLSHHIHHGKLQDQLQQIAVGYL